MGPEPDAALADADREVLRQLRRRAIEQTEHLVGRVGQQQSVPGTLQVVATGFGSQHDAEAPPELGLEVRQRAAGHQAPSVLDAGAAVDLQGCSTTRPCTRPAARSASAALTAASGRQSSRVCGSGWRCASATSSRRSGRLPT
jgi:hypothetical protein